MAHSFFYVLQVKTGQEKTISEEINEKFDAVDALFLQRRLYIRRGGKNFWELQPVFPGYIFVCTEDSLVPKDMMLLRKVKGVAHFLPSNEDVRGLNEQDYALVQQFLSFGEIAEPSTAFFDKDDRIVIVDGPMKGMEGQITSVDRRKRRVKLVVTMFDTEMTLKLSYNLIEKKDS